MTSCARRAGLAVLAAALIGACRAAPNDAPPASAPRVVVRPHAFRGPEVRCDPDRLVAPDVPAAKAQCAEGIVKACARLLELAAPAPDAIALATRVLATTCARDRAAAGAHPSDAALATARTCSCGALGAAATYDRAREVEGIALLDEACTHGLLDACDHAALIEELCTLASRPMCDDLLAQGRVRTPPPGDDAIASVAELSGALVGCFVVTERGEAPLSVGAFVCFGRDRISWRAPGAGWDQRAVEWRGWAGVGVFVASPGGPRLVVKDGVVRYGEARLAPADASVAREAAAVPSAREACERARRCDEALAARARARLPSPTTAGDEGPGELLPITALGPPPATLRACERHVRDRVGGAPSAPAPCR